MIFIPRRKVVVFLFFVGLISFYSFALHFDSENAFSHKGTKCIVLDAGHGLPDGGAIGMTGTIESSLNLEIAKKAKKVLEKNGYRIIMTRKDENSVYEEGQSIAAKKKSDMKKRLEIINSSGADMFVSIHMNKFSSPVYCGAQVIYSGNFKESQVLATLIQKELHKIPDNNSKRAALKGSDGIFLLKNAKIPAVIVECGFLSNFNEEKLLSTKKYQQELVEAIAEGIGNYYERVGISENFCN